MPKNRLKNILKIYEKKDTKEVSEWIDLSYTCFGFSSFLKFENWCFSNNILAKKYYSNKEFDNIESILKFQKYNKSLYAPIKANKNLYNALVKYIDYNDSSIKSPFVNSFIDIKSADKKTLFAELVKKIPAHHSILKENIVVPFRKDINNFFEPFLKIIELKSYWIRDLDDWKPATKNVLKLFKSLIEHLFVKFKYPTIIYSFWFKKDSSVNLDYCLAFISVVQGNSVKNSLTNSNLFPELSKKEYHSLINPKFASYEIDSAIREIQVSRHTQDKRIIKIITKSRYNQDTSFDYLLFPFLNLISKESMFNVNQALPLFDYIQYLKTEYDNNNRKFLLKGRKINSLLLGMADWHKIIGKNTTYTNWKLSHIGDYEHILKGEKPHLNQKFRIYELNTSDLLYLESKILRHCVSSYARSCFFGGSIIFTLDRIDSTGTKKLLTIELDSSFSIVQVRGSVNRTPTHFEVGLLKLWSGEKGIDYEG
jgi:hypothetical protein